jgi:hypothetical protein
LAFLTHLTKQNRASPVRYPPKKSPKKIENAEVRLTEWKTLSTNRDGTCGSIRTRRTVFFGLNLFQGLRCLIEHSQLKIAARS